MRVWKVCMLQKSGESKYVFLNVFQVSELNFSKKMFPFDRFSLASESTW